MKTTGNLAKETSISRYTLSQAARKGWLGKAVEQRQESIGVVYYVNDEHPDYLAWLTKHQNQPRVKGKKSKAE